MNAILGAVFRTARGAARPAAVVAGAILAMLVDIMIREATGATYDYLGLVAVVRFLIAFVLTKSG